MKKLEEIYNPHAIGVIVKEAVRRAMVAIRKERFVFEATAKQGYGGKVDDLVTSADKKAQAIFIKILKECFPGFGIIAEEQELKIPCTIPGVDIYFTVDPLDGTKAFARRQSHGIGTMIGLVMNGMIIAAFIGDVMTEEIYYFRPNSNKVHRISEYEHGEILTIDESKSLAEQYVLLREPPHTYSDIIQWLLPTSVEKNGFFSGIEITGGSIGVSIARLWKSEMGAAVLAAGHNTPWDLVPFLGICEKLGYVFLRPSESGTRFQEYHPLISKEVKRINHETLILHKNRVSELNNFLGF